MGVCVVGHFSKSRWFLIAAKFTYIMVWRLGEKPVVIAPASEEPEMKSMINLRNSLRAGNLSGAALEEAHSKLEELGLTDEKQRSAFIASSQGFLTELDAKRSISLIRHRQVLPLKPYINLSRSTLVSPTQTK